MQQGYAKLSLAIAALLVASFPLEAAAQGLPQSPDSIYFTLSGSASIDGPVYEPGSGVSAVTHYANAVTKETLTQADHMAAFWLEEENPEAYVTFLTGALVLPMHESGLQHYRKLGREGGRCAETLNSGSLAQSAGAKAERIFDTVMKAGTAPIVPSCTAFRSGDPALQLLGSYDGLSTGLMQINFVAHPDYLPHGDFLSVKKTVARGLEQYFEGFKKIVENPSRYPCLKGAAPGDINYDGVVRGAWAGAYNSGSVIETCRFTALSRSNSTAREQKWARENDAPFKKDFDSAMNVRTGLYADALTGDEAALHHEIANTFEAIKSGADLASVTAQAQSIRAQIARLSGAPAAVASPVTQPARPAQPVQPAAPARPVQGPQKPAAVKGAVQVVQSFFPTTPAAKPIASGTVNLAAGGRLNVRLRPSTEARVMDTLKAGSKIEIYKRFRASGDPVGWVATTPALDRWVYAQYVTVSTARR